MKRKPKPTQTEPPKHQKGTNREPKLSNNVPNSSLGAFEKEKGSKMSVVPQYCKNVRGALVGLT